MNEWKNRIAANGAVAMIIVIGIIISSIILTNGIVEVKGNGDKIAVTGSAKQQITSDLVVWNGSFSAKSANLQEAYTQLEADKNKVSDYLIKQGVKKDQIVFTAINTNIYYVVLPNGQYTSDIDYYDLYQTVTISSADIDRVTEISRNATELINEGVQFQSNAPQYLYTKIADLKVTMLAEATKDARKRAEMIAENAGSKLGGLKYADMGVIQITPLYSNEVSDYGMNDTSSLEKEITAIVHCEFEIK
ncbi:SIMPL domain-containing protein [Clostridium aminobutyricum]|uniref:SIMPL domain-containing protein n=1 Tax=Clostridium aminobutyricum TaxID=33953 RepID=A0A939IG75_CLOAM|nr:SIMPL domain-containing protein [Clostridium aminobutyricum]MBN7772795.1 SIMPL domain-containing protein [Clostridium aminobutyricum]